MTRASSHFLVVIDNLARGERLTRPFADWGWDAVLVGADPQAALARLAEGPFDMVLLGIKAAERAHLWPELVFLYIKYDEFVSKFLSSSSLGKLRRNTG